VLDDEGCPEMDRLNLDSFRRQKSRFKLKQQFLVL
jgi:hypothetical protein